MRQLYSLVPLVLGRLISNGSSEESIRNELDEEGNEIIPHFKTRLDDYLQFSPLAVACGLDAFGIKSKTDLRTGPLFWKREKSLRLARPLY